MQQLLKKNLSSILLLAVVALLLFSAGAKAFVLKALLHTGVFNAATEKDHSLNHKEVFPQLAFADANGAGINTGALQGKVLFINFWATWCPPCIAEMGSINALYNKLKADPGFVFILVDADNNLVGAEAFMKKQGYNLPLYRAAGPIPADFYSGSLPTTLIIDAKGVLVQKHEGIANYDTRSMEQFLRSLTATNLQ